MSTRFATDSFQVITEAKCLDIPLTNEELMINSLEYGEPVGKSHPVPSLQHTLKVGFIFNVVPLCASERLSPWCGMKEELVASTREA